jgi:hypothetical protein
MPPPHGYDQPMSQQQSPPPQQSTHRASNSAPAPSGSNRVEQRRNPDGSTSIQIGAQNSDKGRGAGNDNDYGEVDIAAVKDEPEGNDADN